MGKPKRRTKSHRTRPIQQRLWDALKEIRALLVDIVILVTGSQAIINNQALLTFLGNLFGEFAGIVNFFVLLFAFIVVIFSPVFLYSRTRTKISLPRTLEEALPFLIIGWVTSLYLIAVCVVFLQNLQIFGSDIAIRLLAILAGIVGLSMGFYGLFNFIVKFVSLLRTEKDRGKVENVATTAYAEIKDKMEVYYPSQHVIFRTRFFGELTHGFFSNQIFSPEGTSFNWGSNRISIWAPDTLADGFPNTRGKLNGEVNKVSEWSWMVPQEAPEGEYRVHMRVHNHFGVDNRPAVYERIDTFKVSRYHGSA